MADYEMADVRQAITDEIAALVQLSSVPEAATGYGVDLVCVTDLSPRLTEIDPETTAGIAQDLFHRWTTPRGSLPDDPDYGSDVRRLLHAALTPRELHAARGQLEAEARKDDRISAVTVELERDGEALLIRAHVTPEDKDQAPFTMHVVVTSAAVVLQAIEGSRS